MKLVKICALLLLVTTVTVFAGAGKEEGGTAEKPIKVRIATLISEQSAVGEKANWIAEELEKRSGGRFEVEVFHGGVLGGEMDNLEDILAGDLEMATYLGSGFYQYVPEANVIELPLYNWASREEANEVLYKYWDKLLEVSKKKGFYILGLEDLGYYGLWTREPITSLKEVVGMKFRSIDAPYWIEITKLYGAVPIPLPAPDYYMACKTGVVNGGVGPVGPWVGLGIHEVLKCHIDTQFTLTRTFIASSTKWIESLPDDLRQIVLDVCRESTDVELTIIRRYDEQNKKVLKDAGVTVIAHEDIDPAELAELNKKGWAFRDAYMKGKGPEVYKFYKDWMKFMGEQTGRPQD